MIVLPELYFLCNSSSVVTIFAPTISYRGMAESICNSLIVAILDGQEYWQNQLWYR